MSGFCKAAPLWVALFMWQLTVPVLAGGDAGSGYGSGGSAKAGLSFGVTKTVAKTLSRGFSRCSRLDWSYRYDCYRLVYKRSADLLRGNPAYSEALKALVLVEDTLDTAVKKNRDPAQKPKRRGFEVYQPIKPEAVPKVTRQTEQAIEKAETILLRSPANKQEHYTRIAEALNSNKVLLRSALLPGSIIRFAAHVLGHALQRG